MRLDLDTGFEALLSDPYADHPVRNAHILNGGGGQTSTQQQTQQSETGPPSYLQPYLKSAIQSVSDYYQQNPNAPQYYSGETVAPLSGTTQNAISNATNWANNNPMLPGSAASLNKFTSGAYVDPTTNPDYLKALSASHQPYIDQFNNQILPGVQSGFEGAGRYGSGANQNATQQAVKNLDTTINNADAQAGSQYYQQALNQMLTANSLVPGANQAQLNNINAQSAAGTMIDQNRQAQDAAAQAAYNYNSNAYPNYMAQYMAILNGGYPGGSSSGTSTGTTYQPTNQLGGIMSGAMGGIGLGLQAASLFSDVRLKENIAPIGKTHDGQNIYYYHYKGDRTPRVGLMAQEVAQTKPEAVELDPSGFLKVNYQKALGLF
jgi:hypothetical protein